MNRNGVDIITVRNRYVPTEVLWRGDFGRRRIYDNPANGKIIRRDEIVQRLFLREIKIRDKGEERNQD
jgi:hypothetical protein